MATTRRSRCSTAGTSTRSSRTCAAACPLPKAFDLAAENTVVGHVERSCRRATAANVVTTRDVRAGESVHLTVNRLRYARADGCSGRFTGELRYRVPGRAVTIARYAFTIP